MKLADVVSHSGLAIYAEIALILFFVAFVVVLIRVFAPSRRDEMERAGRMPIEDDAASQPRAGGKP